MLQALYNALSGMRGEQYNIDTIGNNVANINTVAFKGSRVDFADALYVQMNRPLEAGTYLQQGSGMLVNAIQRDMTTGMSMVTGIPTDFMLQGDGYFAIQGQQGACYTRDGSFKVSMENGSGYLVTAEGYYVLDTNNQRIKIPGNASAITSDISGNLYLNNNKFATLKVCTFPNPEGLLDAGGNKVLASAASGAAKVDTQPMVMQGWLEGSNVDMATEMSRLLVAQRAYSVLGTAIRTADDMESLANSMYK
jgi:flagellar basal-body rod protein FlgG